MAIVLKYFILCFALITCLTGNNDYNNNKTDVINAVKQLTKDLDILKKQVNDDDDSNVPVCPISKDSKCGPDYGGTCCPSGSYCDRDQMCSDFKSKSNNPYYLWSEDELKGKHDPKIPVCPEAKSGKRCGPIYVKCCPHGEFCSIYGWCGTGPEWKESNANSSWTMDHQTARVPT